MTDAKTDTMDTPFFFIKHSERIPSDEAIFALLRRYPELPTHYIIKLIDRDYTTGANRLAQLARLGYLVRFNPRRDVSKHSSYSLKERGYRDTKSRDHRIGESILKASTEIGVKENADFEHIPWSEIQLSESFPRDTLRMIDAGKDAHLIPLRDGHVRPDGDPTRIYHKPSNRHINLIDEYDRDTEPLTTTKQRRHIEEKFKHYKEFYDRKLFKSHYGFTNCLLRIVTVSRSRKLAMMRLLEDKFGPNKHTLFASFEEDPCLAVSYPKPEGTFFTTPYDRVGYSPYDLSKFFDMDR